MLRKECSDFGLQISDFVKFITAFIPQATTGNPKLKNGV